MEPTAPTSVRPCVLVVDDSPDMLRYLKLLLESDSYRVETVATGMEALDRLRKGDVPNVVLLDLQMPGMDGLKTLRKLRKLHPDLKVIICSGSEDASQRQKAAMLGAYSYLTKPVHHLYLSAVLERCLSDSTGKGTHSLGNLVQFHPIRWQ